MRLFLALWPDETALQRIVEIQDTLREHITRQGVRFTRPEKIHLTMHFYGDVSERDLATLTARLATVKHAPIEVQTTVLGGFPDLRRPKIVWLGLKGDGLEELQKAAAEAVEGLVEPAEPVFAPHLTLARVSPASQQVGRLIRAIPSEAVDPPAVWIARKVSIVQTLPSAAYEDVFTLDLS